MRARRNAKMIFGHEILPFVKRLRYYEANADVITYTLRVAAFELDNWAQQADDSEVRGPRPDIKTKDVPVPVLRTCVGNGPWFSSPESAE